MNRVAVRIVNENFTGVRDTVAAEILVDGVRVGKIDEVLSIRGLIAIVALLSGADKAQIEEARR